MGEVLYAAAPGGETDRGSCPMARKSSWGGGNAGVVDCKGEDVCAGADTDTNVDTDVDTGCRCGDMASVAVIGMREGDLTGTKGEDEAVMSMGDVATWGSISAIGSSLAEWKECSIVG